MNFKFTSELGVKDLDKFEGKPTIITYILNEEYEITIITPLGWKIIDLPYILKDSFVETPKHVHIISIKEDISASN